MAPAVESGSTRPARVASLEIWLERLSVRSPLHRPGPTLQPKRRRLRPPAGPAKSAAPEPRPGRNPSCPCDPATLKPAGKGSPHVPWTPHKDRDRITRKLYGLLTTGAPPGTRTPNPRFKSGNKRVACFLPRQPDVRRAVVAATSPDRSKLPSTSPTVPGGFLQESAIR